MGLLEVIIIPGPNVQAPVFTKDSYEIAVNEDSTVDSVVFNFQVPFESFQLVLSASINHENVALVFPTGQRS